MRIIHFYPTDGRKFLESGIIDVKATEISRRTHKGFKGTLTIEFFENSPKEITGEHGWKEYEEEYGFRLIDLKPGKTYFLDHKPVKVTGKWDDNINTGYVVEVEDDEGKKSMVKASDLKRG